MDNSNITTFERRQRILEMLTTQASVKVSNLAEMFEVSETTIRNDLSALEEENKLQRVHGGAVAPSSLMPASVSDGISSQFANVEVKKRIAKWAADMIEDGDSILMDASTTVMCMTPYLQKYRNLTIVTNGLETARILSENPSHTVVLIGGIVSPSGRSITSIMGADILKNLHFRLAFISCVGLSVDVGLTERNIEEARLKQEMLRAAHQVIALVDSSKLAKVSLAPFANLSEISYLVTDVGAEASIIDRIQHKGISVTVCGDNTVTSYRDSQAQTTYRIGFANLTEASQFSVDVRRGLERAAQNAHNIDLLVYDNQLDPAQAMRVADQLIDQDIDLAIEYQIDYKTGSLLMKQFQRENIPVIAVDIPIVGATFFGVDNYRSGHMAGIALGEWVQTHWAGRIEKLLVLIEPRAGSLPETRIHGQLDGLQEVIGSIPEDLIMYLESGNTTIVSESQMMDALMHLNGATHIAILSFNDDAALGALQAARRLDREGDVAIVGQGADRLIRNEIRRHNSPVIGSTAFFPEGYGEKLLNLAQKIVNGVPVPPAVYMEHVFIHRDNVNFYYPD